MPIVMAVSALLRLGGAAQTTALRARVEIDFTGVIAFDAVRDFLQALIGAVSQSSLCLRGVRISPENLRVAPHFHKHRAAIGVFLLRRLESPIEVQNVSSTICHGLQFYHAGFRL